VKFNYGRNTCTRPYFFFLLFYVPPMTFRYSRQTARSWITTFLLTKVQIYSIYYFKIRLSGSSSFFKCLINDPWNTTISLHVKYFFHRTNTVNTNELINKMNNKMNFWDIFRYFLWKVSLFFWLSISVYNFISIIQFPRIQCYIINDIFRRV